MSQSSMSTVAAPGGPPQGQPQQGQNDAGDSVADTAAAGDAVPLEQQLEELWAVVVSMQALQFQMQQALLRHGIFFP